MVTLVIVDYNSFNKTINYINHINEKFEGEKINFIVVDNSPDNIEFYEFLRNRKYKEVIIKNIGTYGKYIKDIAHIECNNYNLILVKSTENLGYAKGNNLGAIISKYFFDTKYLIFSNNDLVFRRKINARELFIPFEQDSKIAVVGPRIIGNKKEDQSPRKKISIWKQIIINNVNMVIGNKMNKYITNLDYSKESKYTYWVMGCFMIVDAIKFSEVNMFDENTFLFAEEMILSERMEEKGYKTFFYNDIEIIHEHGFSVKNELSIISAWRISFESNYYYFEKYRNSKKFELYLAKVSFYIFKYGTLAKGKIKKYLK